MNKLNKYFAIAYIAGKSNLAYTGEVGSRLLFLGVILYIFMCVWKAVFENSHATSIGGYSMKDLVWYMALTEAIFISAPRVTAAIDEDVRTGAVAVQLVRPLSYPLYRLASDLGERTVRFLVTLLAAMIIGFVLVGPCDHFLSGLALVALALPGAFVLDFLGYLIVGLGAFWLEDTSGLTLIYSRLTMILGGMMLPLELFPKELQPVLHSLPFGSIVCGPARLLIHQDPIQLALLLANQLCWIGIFAFVAALIYSRALNRVALNGG